MRGRLIIPFLAELAQLDTQATAADPDGAGPLTSGYDADFREPILTGTSPGTVRRVEHTAIRVPCQVEVAAFDALNEMAAGNAPSSRVVLVFHFADLEAAGLVDATTGEALIRPRDRLVSIRKCTPDAPIIQAIRTPPGLYAVDAQPQSFGLSGGERNLLIVGFEQRDVSTTAGGG